jgi:hypothetical protein
MALRRMEDLEAELAPVHARIAAFSRRQARLAYGLPLRLPDLEGRP